MARGRLDGFGEFGLELAGALLLGDSFSGRGLQRGSERFDLGGELGASLLLFNRLCVSGVDLRLQSRLGVGLVAGGGLAGGRELAVKFGGVLLVGGSFSGRGLQRGLQRFDFGGEFAVGSVRLFGLLFGGRQLVFEFGGLLLMLFGVGLRGVDLRL